MKSAHPAPWVHLGRKESREIKGAQEFLPLASLEKKDSPVLQGTVDHLVPQAAQGLMLRGSFLTLAHPEIGDLLALTELEDPLDFLVPLGVLTF